MLGFEELYRKIDETIAVGGVQVLMQGGHNPDLPLTWYEDLFRAIKARYPEFKLHALFILDYGNPLYTPDKAVRTEEARQAFARWAGISAREGLTAFDSLRRSLTAVRTSIGGAWILTRDEPAFRAGPGPVAAARLLPSGDAYYLLQGDDRALLVPDADHRGALWTSRVWPGAVLLDGEISGTWRRANETLTIQTWGRPSRAARQAVDLKDLFVWGLSFHFIEQHLKIFSLNNINSSSGRLSAGSGLASSSLRRC